MTNPSPESLDVIRRALANAQPPSDGMQGNVVALPGGAYEPEEIDRLNERYALITIGSRAMVLEEPRPGALKTERLRLLAVEAFKHVMANRRVRINDKWRTYGELWLADPRRRDLAGVEFEPSPDGNAGHEGYYNLWRGFEVEPDPSGDCTALLSHIEEVICRADMERFDWVMSWFASIFQRPRERFGTALALIGGMGAGKTMVGEIIGSLIEPHYFLIDTPRYLTGQFNSHMAACLLLQADEGFWAGDKQAEGRLKGLITASRQMIEQKGIDAIELPNRVRLLVTSNEDWVVPAGLKERRWAVLQTSDVRIGNLEYFAQLRTAMDCPGAKEKLLYELLNWSLRPLDLRQAPTTPELLEQKIFSGDAVLQWWERGLRHGELDGMDWPEEPRWLATRWLHRSYIRHCLAHGIRRPADERSFMKRLLALCPALKQRRKGRDDTQASLSGEMPDHLIKRPWGYDLPTLSEAREVFATAVGQAIDWQDGDGDTEPPEQEVSDVSSDEF